MEFDVLILPLVGGYYLLTHAHRFKYYHQRLSDQRLIFNSVIAGTTLWISAFVLTYFVEEFNGCQRVKPLAAYFGLQMDYLGTSMMALAISLGLVYFDNRFVHGERKAIEMAIDKIGTHLEKLLKDALKSEQTVSITLKSNKVYVAWPLRVPIPRQSEYIVVTPLISGYRNNETKEVIFTTEYISVVEDEEQQFSKEDFSLVIKTDDIVSIGLFDIAVYERFQT